MIAAENIREIAEEVLEGSGLYVLDIKVHGYNDIHVEIDGMSPVGIDDCIRLSREIESRFDREVEDFSLQVATPGIDQALRDKRQYVKNQGREVKVKTKDGKQFEGVLVRGEEEGAVVVVREKVEVEGKKKKEWVEREIFFPYEEIKETRIKISFK